MTDDSEGGVGYRFPVGVGTSARCCRRGRSRRRDIYHWRMNGSYSQKSVLPVLVPEMSYEGGWKSATGRWIYSGPHPAAGEDAVHGGVGDPRTSHKTPKIIQ